MTSTRESISKGTKRYWFITGAFMLVSAFLLLYKRPLHCWNDGYYVDEAAIGTYGDFIGGVLGTIFAVVSVVIVVKTFHAQQEITSKSNTLQESALLQQEDITRRTEEMDRLNRFSQLFFQLLELYQREVNALRTRKDGVFYSQSSEVEYISGVEFFDVEMAKCQNNYHSFASTTTPKQEYESFYNEYASRLAPYFRTLYRMCDLLYNSSIPLDEKHRYIKIMRAQLSGAETFFLYYNACSFYGRPFQHYIKYYNLLKHIPIFDLMEFASFWSELKMDTTIDPRGAVNMMFATWRKWIKKAIKIAEKYPDRRLKSSKDLNILSDRYSFRITLSKRRTCGIKIRVNKTVEPDINTDFLMCRMEENPERMVELIEKFLDFIFCKLRFTEKTQERIKTYKGRITENEKMLSLSAGIRCISSDTILPLPI